MHLLCYASMREHNKYCLTLSHVYGGSTEFTRTMWRIIYLTTVISIAVIGFICTILMTFEQQEMRKNIFRNDMI